MRLVGKLLVLNDYNGLRDGLHGGSELVQLQQKDKVCSFSLLFALQAS